MAVPTILKVTSEFIIAQNADCTDLYGSTATLIKAFFINLPTALTEFGKPCLVYKYFYLFYHNQSLIVKL